MKRLTVSLPDRVAIALEREVHKRRSTASALVRDAITAYLDPTGGKPRELPFANIGRSGTRNTARQAEEILAAEWGDAACGR